MTDLSAPIPASEAGALPQPAAEPSAKIKIGEVAQHFDISVDLLRLYEREGLLIPLKSPKGTRYFTRLDYPWIATILRLIRQSGLNFAGIRYLLALLPCHELRGCDAPPKANCSVNASATEPCWTHKTCCSPGDCYVCDVYRAAGKCENLKVFVSNAAPALDSDDAPAEFPGPANDPELTTSPDPSSATL
jgi:DNA-binding transcriptional MerR regulator